MKLRFDEFGDIKTNELGHLEDVDDVSAELGRFQMFFDTPIGHYFYDTNFGNSELDIIGTVDVTSEDLQMYTTSLREHLVSSMLLSEFSINADFLTQDTLTLQLLSSGSNDPIIWEYKTKTGRLSEVTDKTPEKQYHHQIHSHTFISTGDIVYDISSIIAKAKEINSINLFDTVEWKHRLFINLLNHADDGELCIHYEFNDIDEELSLYTPVAPGSYLKLEIWPAETANLEATNNPYLMRKQV